MSSPPSWPVVVVTGANSGVGFGICQRLLLQLISKSVTDAHPLYDFHLKDKKDDQLSFGGLTLILACRNKQRGEVARDKLYRLVDERVRHLESSQGYDGHATTFRKHLTIAVHTVDLAHIQTVFHFADEVTASYPYISHLICNAGVAPFASINWFSAIRELLTDWVRAVTAPTYYTQEVGQLSKDGLGWVWQCNVFGHYVLFRALKSQLDKCKMSTGARVIWMSSHEANSTFYDSADWQLTKTAHSYESSKFQVDLIAHQLDQASLRKGSGESPVRHLIVLPGIAGTNITSTLLGTFLTTCMILSFYIARFLGSPYHPISTFKAAVSAVHLCLVPLVFLPTVSTPEVDKSGTASVEVGVRYISQCDRWGRESVGTMQLALSKEQEKQGDDLLGNCERLLTAFCEAEGRPVPL